MRAADSRNHEWLSLVTTSGLVVSLPVLGAAFPEGPESVGERAQRKFELAWQRFNIGVEQDRADAPTRWLDFILDELLEAEGHWLKHPRIPESATHALAEYQQVLRPQRVLVDEQGSSQLLVSIVPPAQSLDAKETATGTWRASPYVKHARLLRETDHKLGLVTNGWEFRLVASLPGINPAYLSWQAKDWADEKSTLNGFYTLLRAERFIGDEKQRLGTLVDDSQDKQLELTDQLGDQVRQALEVLLRGIDRCDLDSAGELLREMEHAEIYQMGLFFMMRLVFLLYAEENYLLPHGEVLYDQAYGVTHLWTELSRQRAERPEAMATTFDAYPRLLATFRLVYEGCPHPDLNLIPYGGKLFDPQRFPVLEDRRLRISNHLIHTVLHKLLFARAKVAGQTGLHRLSYGSLDIEQIGTVYEGLIAYTAKRAPAEQTLVVFRGSDQTMRPLAELESQAPEQLPDYVRQLTGFTEKQTEKALAPAALEGADVPDQPPGMSDELYQQLLAHRNYVDIEAAIPAGHLYVAHESGLRKGQGVYYTPKWITSFICERTLEPLVYEGDGDERRVKSPREILDLKVCDPAMGSGAFLVQACRYLAERLVESWDLLAAELPDSKIALPYGEPTVSAPGEILLPEDHEEALTWARRFVVEHCLYGVDINPLAVELAKMSLWLITLAEGRPFEFLDHKLKCGNSLIGCWTEDLGEYPAKAWGRKDPDKQVTAALREIGKQARTEARRLEQDEETGAIALVTRDALRKRTETADEIRRIEDMDTLYPQEKEDEYRRLVTEDTDWQNVRRAYDAWCALWFWPVAAEDSPDDVPLPRDYQELVAYLTGKQEGRWLTAEETLRQWAEQVAKLREQQRFFHWELEFPDAFEQGGFDTVVMNPPWGVDLALCKTLIANARLGYVPRDSFEAFVGQSANSLMPGLGRAGIVLPDIILLKDYYPDTRKVILEASRPEVVLECGKAFSQVAMGAVVIVSQRIQATDDDQITFLAAGESGPPLRHTSEVSVRAIRQQPHFRFNKLMTRTNIDFLERLRAISVPLKEILAFSEGIHSGNARRRIFLESEEPGSEKLVVRHNPTEYPVLPWDMRYFSAQEYERLEPPLYARAGDLTQHSNPKIVVPRTSPRVMAYLDRTGLLVSNNFFVGVVPADENGLLDFCYVYLNSLLPTLLHRLMFPRSLDLFPEVKINHLYQLMVPFRGKTSSAITALARRGTSGELRWREFRKRCSDCVMNMLPVGLADQTLHIWEGLEGNA